MNSASILVFLLSGLSGSVHATFLPGTVQPTFVQPSTHQAGTYQPVSVTSPTQQSGSHQPVTVRNPDLDIPASASFTEKPSGSYQPVSVHHSNEPSGTYQPVSIHTGTHNSGENQHQVTPPSVTFEHGSHNPGQHPPGSFHPGTPTPSVFLPTPSSSARRKIQSIAFDPDSDQAKCPQPLTACVIPSPKSSIKANSWECLNLQEELNSCGSCNHDCMKIPHVGNAGCQSGGCKIFSCAAGYTLQQRRDSKSGKMVDACV